MASKRHHLTYTNRRYLDAIADHVVIFDGAMGTSIQNQNLSADDFGGERYDGCNDYLVITRPDVIEAIHASFLAVGAEAVETDTFRSNRLTLTEYGLGERVLEINRAGAAIARRVCDRFAQETGIPRFVAGSIGPSGKLPSGTDPDLSNVSFDELAALFYEQAQGLVEGGADLLLVETSQDILEVKAAVDGINRYFADAGVRIPLQAQITLDVSGRMLFGTDIGSALATLEALPIDVIGLNCSTGPEHMREPIKYLVEHSPLPISVLPNAGLPINVDGEAVYPMEPDPFSHMVAEFSRWGVNVVGGCCGTRPEHIARLVAVHPRHRRRLAQADANVARDAPAGIHPCRLQQHEGHGPAPEPRPDPDRRARQQPGQPQGQAPAAGRRLRQHPANRARPGRQWRAPAGRVRGAHRARRRKRADGHAGQKAGPGGGRPADHRHDRSGRGRSRPGDLSRPRGAQRQQPGKRPGADRQSPAHRQEARRGGAVHDHRRGGHGPHPRQEAGDRPPHPGHRGRRLRPGPGGPDLRYAHLPPDHRPGGAAQRRGRDAGSHPPDQAGIARRADRPGREQRVLRRLAGAARRAQQRLPVSRRAGRAGHGDRQSGPHHALCRNPAGTAQARRRPDLQQRSRRPAALHPVLRAERGPAWRQGSRRPHRRHDRRGSPALADRPSQEGRRRGPGRYLPDPARRGWRAQQRPAAGHEGSRGQVRRGRADPALRAAKRRGDEEVRGLPGNLHGEGRRLHQGRRSSWRRSTAMCTILARIWSRPS